MESAVLRHQLQAPSSSSRVVRDRYGCKLGEVVKASDHFFIVRRSLFGRWWQLEQEFTYSEVDFVDAQTIWLRLDLRHYWELDTSSCCADYELHQMETG